MQNERWLPVIGYEGRYEVSDQGRVRSIDRTVPHAQHGTATYRGKILSIGVGRGAKNAGRSYVNLSALGRPRGHSVPRLVITAFVGPAPEGTECCHKDGDPRNNRLDNLRWGTHVSNMHDKTLHGTDRQRAKTHCPREHELKEPNLTRVSVRRGCRSCLACSRAYHRTRYYGTDDLKERADIEYQLIMAGKKAGWLSPTCGKGHEFTAENTIRRRGRPRECRKCANLAKRQRRQAS